MSRMDGLMSRMDGLDQTLHVLKNLTHIPTESFRVIIMTTVDAVLNNAEVNIFPDHTDESTK